MGHKRRIDCKRRYPYKDSIFLIEVRNHNTGKDQEALILVFFDIGQK